MKVRFEEVARTVTKKGICPVCKKHAKRSQKFYQSLSPWNLDESGNRKNRATIEAELRVEMDEWTAKPTFHKKCKYLVN